MTEKAPSQALYCAPKSNCLADLNTWMFHKPQNSSSPPQCLASSFLVPQAGPSNVPASSFVSYGQSGPQFCSFGFLIFYYS